MHQSVPMVTTAGVSASVFVVCGPQIVSTGLGHPSRAKNIASTTPHRSITPIDHEGGIKYSSCVSKCTRETPTRVHE